MFHFCEVARIIRFRHSRWNGGARGWGRGASVSWAERQFGKAEKFWRWMVGKASQQRRRGGGISARTEPDTRDPRSPSTVGLPGKGRMRLSRVDVDGDKGVHGLGKMKARGS